MRNYNAFRDNLQPGFNGVEGREEETFVFYLNGEVEIEDYNEESAEQQLLDMTVRELISRGFEIE